MLGSLLHAAETPSTLEYRVKAAFLLNFAKFAEWPSFPAAEEPFSICVVGDDPFAGTLDRVVDGESIEGHKIVVQRIQRGTATTCHIAFIAKSEKEVAKLLETLGPNVLTVGDEAEFLREGGMIAFAIDNRRVRFDVNQPAVRRGGLKLSSRLLSVARSVEK